MISLPVIDCPATEDSDVDAHIEKSDIQVTLTFAEHELMCDLLNAAMEMMNFASPYGSGLHDLSLDNEIVQRYTAIDNLRERFQILWSDRFNTFDESNHNEIL
jgi:hypothetical protein